MSNIYSLKYQEDEESIFVIAVNMLTAIDIWKRWMISQSEGHLNNLDDYAILEPLEIHLVADSTNII